MKIQKIGTRNVIFTYDLGVWDLNIHLLLGDHYNYIIDTGLGSKSVEPVIEYLKENHKPIIVINTHYHWDHIWGNHCFKDSMIIAHTSCVEWINKRWDTDLETREAFFRGDIEKALPNVLINDTMYFPEDGVTIFYAPGHTTDGLNVYDERDKVLNVGDNIGDTMEELIPCLSTDKKTYLTSIAYYERFDVISIVSGHNKILDKTVFKKIRELL